VLFAGIENISKKYKLIVKTGEDLLIYSTNNIDPKIITLDNKIKNLVI